MKIYVVCEDYTCAFCGLYNSAVEAKRRAEEVGGFIEKYKVKNGQLIKEED